MHVQADGSRSGGRCTVRNAERHMSNGRVFQDQKQTDSIQVLQSQLENVTRLMLNLTAAVGQLQREVR